MAKAIIDEQSLTDIADAIRTKNGSADTYTPSEMATAITDLPSGGTVGAFTKIYTEKITTETNTISNAGDLLTYLQSKAAELHPTGTLIGWSLTEKQLIYNTIWGSNYSSNNLPVISFGFRYRNGALTTVNMSSGYDAVLPANIDVVLYIAEYDYTV